MKNIKILILIFFIVSCSSDDTIRINGDISNPGLSEVQLERPVVHYKYAEKDIRTIEPDPDGNFSIEVDVNDTEIARFFIDELSYPLVLQPGRNLRLTADRNTFPRGVEVDGYDTNWNDRYQSYLAEVSPVNTLINEQLPAFHEAEANQVPDLYRTRADLAKEYLEETPLRDIYYYNVGEYLNYVFRDVANQKEINPDYNGESSREAAFEFAREHNFFSFESLEAQRAGIRDFAHYYAMSFNVQDSIRSLHGEQLAEQDIKRLGYEKLNEYRERVIEEIGDPKARAYAEMHLVAERLGEIPLNIAEPTYYDYVETYEEFEEYTSFLTKFYEEITMVSPGEPAVPFTLPDPDGEMVSMSDFTGKYVLLDFWASWCIPCLDEFPAMRQIYAGTSRDDFEIIALSIEADSLMWRSALDHFDNPWIQVYGGNEFLQETFREYRGGGIPFYILIDREGNVERYNDIRATFNLESVLDSLLVQNPGD